LTQRRQGATTGQQFHKAGFASNELGAQSPMAAGFRRRTCCKQGRVLERTLSMAREMAELPSKQTFRFTAPSATTVSLAGEFTDWQKRAIPMQKGKDGIWTAMVDLKPGKHSYRFIVDGQWADDPDCQIRVPNPYGTQNMVRKVA
jgi:1,4-alpha-glucan branching enzyme